MTSALTNQRRVFKACLTQTEQVSDDFTRKIGPLYFTGNQTCDDRIKMIALPQDHEASLLIVGQNLNS